MSPGTELDYAEREPDEVRVNPELRRTADAHAAWAAARLGIVPPEVRFFGRASAKGKKGRIGIYFDNANTIWLRDDLREGRLLTTVMHETVHAARDARGMEQSEGQVVLETEQLLTILAREYREGRRRDAQRRGWARCIPRARRQVNWPAIALITAGMVVARATSLVTSTREVLAMIGGAIIGLVLAQRATG